MNEEVADSEAALRAILDRNIPCIIRIWGTIILTSVLRINGNFVLYDGALVGNILIGAAASVQFCDCLLLGEEYDAKIDDDLFFNTFSKSYFV